MRKYNFPMGQQFQQGDVIIVNGQEWDIIEWLRIPELPVKIKRRRARIIRRQSKDIVIEE